MAREGLNSSILVVFMFKGKNLGTHVLSEI